MAICLGTFILACSKPSDPPSMYTLPPLYNLPPFNQPKYMGISPAESILRSYLRPTSISYRPGFICSNSTIETQEQCVKFVQS